MAGSMPPSLGAPPAIDERANFDLVRHGHQDLVQAVAFNYYGDRCATGSVDGKIRVFNRHKDGVWRHCDNWGAHAGEILELQWLPPQIYPNLLASLGIEGRFKLWAEDPSAAPGRRFSNRSSTSSAPTTRQQHPTNAPYDPSPTPGGNSSPSPANTNPNPKAAFETRNARAPYRSFSMKYVDDTRHTYLALVSCDGGLTVYENTSPNDLAEYSQLDELAVCARPARGEETSFRVRFDPNTDVCYTALRAGVPADALSLVVAAMDTVRVYRTRDVTTTSLGVATSAKQLYLAAEIPGHRGLVRDVAWAPGNVRGYDIIATACQDGFVRVFKVVTPVGGASGKGKGKAVEGEEWREPAGWSAAEVKKHSRKSAVLAGEEDGKGGGAEAKGGIRAGFDQLRTAGGGERRVALDPAQVRHMVSELSRLDSHRTPVWRVKFDDDGQILGSVGDEGKLLCFKQKPDGTWAKCSELGMIRMNMATP